jgi:hypothetical protein
MINNRALSSFFFRGVNGVSIARGEVCTAICGNEGEGDRVFRKEMV